MVQTVQNGPKCKTVRNGPKWSKWSKMVQNSPAGSKGSKQSKTVQNGPKQSKWSKMVQTVQKVQSVKNGPKFSEVSDLTWSKTVQIFHIDFWTWNFRKNIFLGHPVYHIYANIKHRNYSFMKWWVTTFPDLSNQATFEIATKLRQVQYILNQSEIIYLRGSDEN